MHQAEETAYLLRRYEISAHEYRHALAAVCRGTVIHRTIEERLQLQVKLDAITLTCFDAHFALAMHRLKYYGCEPVSAQLP